MTGWLIPYGDDGRADEEAVRSRGNAKFIVGFGGGVDSTAMTIGLLRRNLRPDAILFADTGGMNHDNEKPETYAFVELFKEYLARRGVALTIVVRNSPRAGYRSLEDDCLSKATLPSRAFGLSSCAFKWKIEAQEQWVAKSGFRVKGQKIIKALGYDSGEVARASVLEDDGYRYWYPLQEWGWSREECKRVILAEGLPLPPKSACFFCPASKPDEVVWLHDNHPDLYARAIAMEQKARAAGDLGSVQGLGRHWTWESVIGMTLEERAKLPKPAPGCVICSESECDMEDAA